MITVTIFSLRPRHGASISPCAQSGKPEAMRSSGYWSVRISAIMKSGCSKGPECRYTPESVKPLAPPHAKASPIPPSGHSGLVIGDNCKFTISDNPKPRTLTLVDRCEPRVNVGSSNLDAVVEALRGELPHARSSDHDRQTDLAVPMHGVHPPTVPVPGSAIPGFSSAAVGLSRRYHRLISHCRFQPWPIQKDLH